MAFLVKLADKNNPVKVISAYNHVFTYGLKTPKQKVFSFGQKGALDGDLETHTGQKWDQDDYRLVRFLETPKQVNPNWSIELIQEVPPVPVKGHIAVCDGGPSEALGHPKIYINLDQPGNHSCIYCGLRFFKDDAHH